MELSFILVSLNTATVQFLREQFETFPLTIVHSYQAAVEAVKRADNPLQTVLLTELGIPLTPGSKPHAGLSFLLQHVAAYQGLRAVIIGTNEFQNGSVAQAMRGLKSKEFNGRWYTSKYTVSPMQDVVTEVYFVELSPQAADEVISHPMAVDWLKVIELYTEYNQQNKLVET